MPNPFVFPSAEELENQRGDWKNLIEEEYILEITEVTIEHDKTSMYQKEEHDEWKVRLKVVSFANGEPAYYEDGTEPDPGQDITLLTWVNPTKMGMLPRPSKARKFLTSAFGKPLSSGVEMSSVEDLIGQRLIGRVYHKQDQKGNIRDRIDDFRPLRSRPPRKSSAAATASPVDPADLLAAAKKVFDEDTEDLPF